MPDTVLADLNTKTNGIQVRNLATAIGEERGTSDYRTWMCL